DARAHEAHRARGARVHRSASGDEEGDLSHSPRRHRRRHRRQDRPARRDADGEVVKLVGVDVGSTTVKAVVTQDGKITWQDYQRHNTRQAEKLVEFLQRMETEAGLTVGEERGFFTGSGAGLIAPPGGGKLSRGVWG